MRLAPVQLHGTSRSSCCCCTCNHLFSSARLCKIVKATSTLRVTSFSSFRTNQDRNLSERARCSAMRYKPRTQYQYRDECTPTYY